MEQAGGINVFNFEVEGNHNYFILAKKYDYGQTSILVHNACKSPIVLGETMKDRVKPVAQKYGFSFFNAKSQNEGRWMINQIRWIKEQIKSGRKIFDIGIHRGRLDGRSPYYNAEVTELLNAGYQRVFKQWVKVDGKNFRLYEWVK